MWGFWSGEHGITSKCEEMHWGILGVTCLLALIGVAMMVSAGNGELYPWAAQQAGRFAFSFIIMLAIAFTPQHLLLRYAYVIYSVCVALLIVVEIAGHVGMGAQRWVKIGFINLQPSELMKVALILALARYFHYLHSENIKRFLFILPALGLMALPALFILIQPNLGTTTILIVIGAVMLFMVGVQLRYFVGSIALVVSMAPLAWHFLHEYQKRRVLTFLDPERDPLGAGYNILQSMIAIGSGGITGRGFMQGSQGQLDFLPEKQTDFVFTMLTEEFGFMGGVSVIFLYGMLIYWCVSIALRSKNLFGTMLASGVAGLFFIHVCINMAMVMGMIPVVGVPLPLLSYGGSIMLSAMIGIGLVLNSYIHRDISLTSELR